MQLLMKKPRFERSPTLNTVLMVEKIIEHYSGELDRTELWKKLPKKVMWQTYVVILNYLTENNKILIDDSGIILWTWNPKLIRMLEKRGVIKK